LASLQKTKYEKIQCLLLEVPVSHQTQTKVHFVNKKFHLSYFSTFNSVDWINELTINLRLWVQPQAKQ